MISDPEFNLPKSLLSSPSASASSRSASPPQSRRASQRARLARLREEAEPLIAEERSLALRALLQRPLLTPDGSTAAVFTLVRRHRKWLADWFAHHADWSLVVTAEAARLRKRTATPKDSTRGAIEPHSGECFTRSRYVLFCLALAALERSGRQITLGRLAEDVTVALAAEPAFAACGFLWSLDHFSGRRDFVHTLRLLVSLGVLRRLQGDEEKLLHEREADVLYNIHRPVLALLLAARRSPSLIAAETPAEFETRLAALIDAARPDSPDARNRALRIAFVSRLLDDPVLYYDTLDDEARAYLDRQRPFLLEALTEATQLHAEVRLEGIALVDLDGDCTDSGLPEEGTEGHLTLLLATWLADRLRDGNASPVTIEAVRQRTARCIRQHRHHWKKEVAERGAESWIAETVITRLAGLALVERTADAIRPLPALGRFALRATPELAPVEETGEFPLG